MRTRAGSSRLPSFGNATAINRNHFFWNDENGDGIVQESEFRDHPFTPPSQIFRYHGEQWLEDLSLVALNQAGQDIWRLAPSGFDPHGKPIFREWTKLLTDPVLRLARQRDSRRGSWRQ